MLRALGGRYRLVRQIGAGGMGRVFQAVDTKSGKVVAAKILFASSEADLEALLRFQQEGAVLSTLKHPNIVTVYGTFLEEHTSCIVMELLEGQSLGELLDAGSIDRGRLRDVAQQTARALAYAHGKGIVHRDIKPDNIMVSNDGPVKVTDFGIARILRPGSTLNTMTGMTLGTPLYMAPEQIEGREVDGRADIYSLGAVLYQAVTGRPPFEGADPITVAFRHVHDAPEPPGRIGVDVPADWEALILKALAKEPADRYPSATAFEQAIARLSTEPSRVPKRPPEGEPPQAERARMRVVTPPPRPAETRDTESAHGPQSGPVARPARAAIRRVGLDEVPRPSRARVGRVGRSLEAWPGKMQRLLLRPRSLIALPVLALGIALAMVIPLLLPSTSPAVTILGKPVPGWTVHSTTVPFSFPQDAVAGPTGTIYVADKLNNRIARLSATGTPLAPWGTQGSGEGELHLPEAVAVDGSGNVYVADTGNNRIQEFSYDGRFLNSWGPLGSGDGQFNQPSGLAVDHTGQLFVVDSGNSRIQVFRRDGTFLRSWNIPGVPSLTSPVLVGIALSPGGNVYVSDVVNNRINEFSPTGHPLGKLGEPGLHAGQLNGPSGLAVDAAGDVYVADSRNSRIERFLPNRTAEVWGADLALSNPQGISIDGSGNLLVADAGNSRIERRSPAGNIGAWDGNAAQTALLIKPGGIAVGGSGNVVVADTGHDRILEVAPDGDLLQAWGPRGLGYGRFTGPYAVAVDPTGNIYVADTLNNRVVKLLPDGRFRAAWSGSRAAPFSAPRGVAVAPGGEIYVADSGNQRIVELSPSGAVVRTWNRSDSVGTGFRNPYGIAVDARGTVYVADQNNDRIEVFDARGQFLYLRGAVASQLGGQASGLFSAPQGVAVDSNRSLYVADTGNNRIQQLSARGVLLAVVPSHGSSLFLQPFGIAVDAGGNAYVADTLNNRIVKIGPS
jgi:tripartite motif-containing protein 71